MKEMFQYLLPPPFSSGDVVDRPVSVFKPPKSVIDVNTLGEKTVFSIPGNLDSEQTLLLKEYLAINRLVELSPLVRKVGYDPSRLPPYERTLYQKALDFFNGTGLNGMYLESALAGIPMAPPDFLIPAKTK